MHHGTWKVSTFVKPTCFNTVLHVSRREGGGGDDLMPEKASMGKLNSRVGGSIFPCMSVLMGLRREGERERESGLDLETI